MGENNKMKFIQTHNKYAIVSIFLSIVIIINTFAEGMITLAQQEVKDSISCKVETMDEKRTGEIVEFPVLINYKSDEQDRYAIVDLKLVQRNPGAESDSVLTAEVVTDDIYSVDQNLNTLEKSGFKEEELKEILNIEDDVNLSDWEYTVGEREDGSEPEKNDYIFYHLPKESNKTEQIIRFLQPSGKNNTKKNIPVITPKGTTENNTELQLIPSILNEEELGLSDKQITCKENSVFLTAQFGWSNLEVEGTERKTFTAESKNKEEDGIGRVFTDTYSFTDKIIWNDAFYQKDEVQKFELIYDLEKEEWHYCAITKESESIILLSIVNGKYKTIQEMEEEPQESSYLDVEAIIDEKDHNKIIGFQVTDTRERISDDSEEWSSFEIEILADVTNSLLQWNTQDDVGSIEHSAEFKAVSLFGEEVVSDKKSVYEYTRIKEDLENETVEENTEEASTELKEEIATEEEETLTEAEESSAEETSTETESSEEETSTETEEESSAEETSTETEEESSAEETSTETEEESSAEETSMETEEESLAEETSTETEEESSAEETSTETEEESSAEETSMETEEESSAEETSTETEEESSAEEILTEPIGLSAETALLANLMEEDSEGEKAAVTERPYYPYIYSYVSLAPRIFIEDSLTAETKVGYCYNHDLPAPNATMPDKEKRFDDRYNEPVDFAGQLTPDLENNKNVTEAFIQDRAYRLKKVIYAGYPIDALNFREKYASGADDMQLQIATQIVVWYELHQLDLVKKTGKADDYLGEDKETYINTIKLQKNSWEWSMISPMGLEEYVNAIIEFAEKGSTFVSYDEEEGIIEPEPYIDFAGEQTFLTYEDIVTGQKYMQSSELYVGNNTTGVENMIDIRLNISTDSNPAAEIYAYDENGNLKSVGREHIIDENEAFVIRIPSEDYKEGEEIKLVADYPYKKIPKVVQFYKVKESKEGAQDVLSATSETAVTEKVIKTSDTTQFVLHKVDEETNQHITGNSADFVFFRTAQDGTDREYYIGNNEWTRDKEKAKEYTTTNQGSVYVGDIKTNGTSYRYWFEEIRAPLGYQLLEEPVEAEKNTIIHFYNKQYTPVDVSLNLKKYLKFGTEEVVLNGGEYSFQIKLTKREIQIGDVFKEDTNYHFDETVQNDASGQVSINGISLPDAGKYEFTISEVQGTDKEVIYDQSVYKVYITAAAREHVLYIEDIYGKRIVNEQGESVEEQISDIELIQFVNRIKTATLPQTGGRGMYPFIFMGGILITAGLFLSFRKMRNKVL